MAVTTTYSLNFLKDLDLESTGGEEGEPTIIKLSNGGFAVSSSHDGGAGVHIDGDLFNAAGINIGSWNDGAYNNGFDASLAQLSNGNIVQFSEDGAGHLLFEIRSITGASVKTSTETFADTYNPDVTAVTGGFWTASDTQISGDNYDIYIDRWNNAGVYQGFKAVDTSSAQDRGASIAALTGGNVAVAWTRTVGSSTEIHYAIYNSAANVVRASAVLDDLGTVNRNVSLCALANGNFAVTYEDNGFDTGTVDITVGIYSATGVLLDEANITSPNGANDHSNDARPVITQLSNGQLVVAYSDNFNADTDTRVILLSQSLNVLAETTVSTLGILNDAENSSIAAYGAGLLAVFENSDGTNAGEALQVTRKSVGDSAANTINGDDLVDFMNGGGGADHLNGGAGNDTLLGAAAVDVLSGGRGADALDGGLGRDELFGGQGNDKFQFTAPLGVAHADVIDDFSVPNDTIQIDNAVFVGLAAGTLSAGAFHIGGNAHDATDRILYNPTNGALFFDRDGTGAGYGKVLFGYADAGLALTNVDFFVI